MQFLFIPLPKAYAATSPGLGTADVYSILAGTSVTNTGSTTVAGSVGISPGAGGSPNYTGFGFVTLGGSIHDADSVALTAMADRTAAYTALASQGCDTDYGGVTTDLVGKTLVPGVYCSTSFHLTGTLTLNGAASDVWIFKSASDLIMTGGSAVKVVFTGGGQPCNVWWRVVSTATFDANSTLVGNILADTSITFAAGASLDGRALARTAAVTLSSNSITGPTCGTGAGAGGGTTITGVSPAGASSTSSSSSSSSTSVCVAPAIKAAPTIVESRRVSPTSIFLRWSPSDSGIENFIIQYGPDSNRSLYNTRVRGFSTTLNNLPPNVPFWASVTAVGDCGTVGKYGETRLIGGPLLPNTGFGSHESNILWNIATSAGIIILVSALLLTIVSRKRTI